MLQGCDTLLNNSGQGVHRLFIQFPIRSQAVPGFSGQAGILFFGRPWYIGNKGKTMENLHGGQT